MKASGVRVGRWGLAVGLALGLTACEPGEATLVVDLRTDLVPGVEFAAVRTVLDAPRRTDEVAAFRGEDFLAGRRVAELPDVPRGARTLTVTLLDDQGEPVVERELRVALSDALAATVLITRDCREVACPAPGDAAATSCLAGRCVAPDCVLGTEPSCPDPECAAPPDCAAGATCASARCEGGVCLYAADDATCGADAYCEPERGCRPVPGIDAGAADDAGPGDPLSVRSVAPRASSVGGGALLEVEHGGDGTGLEITVGGASCEGLSAAGPGRVRCTTGPHAAGLVDVELRNAAGERAVEPAAFSYQPDGVYQHGTAADDNTSGVAVGPGGWVYVSGATRGDLDGPNQGDFDAYLVAYRPDGSQAWVRTLGTPLFDYARDVAVGADGTVYLAGYTAGTLGAASAGGNDVFVAAFGPDGSERWVVQHGTPGDDQCWDLGVDDAGHVYLAVRTDDAFDGAPSGGLDAALLRIEPGGALGWARQLGTGVDDIGHSLAVDPRGPVYLVGYTAGALESGHTPGGALDLFVARFEADGTLGWIRQRGGAGTDQAYDATVDPGGGLYVVGVSDASFDGQPAQGGTDVIVLRFEADGAWRWSTQIGSSAYDSSWGVSVDADGDPYVAGVTRGAFAGQTSAGGDDGFVTRFDAADGAPRWTRMFGTADSDSPSSCAFDLGWSGLLYVSLNTRGALGGAGAGMIDLALARWAPDGTAR